MTQKEKSEQKHKMAVAIYRAMTPEKQAEFVEENKKKHELACNIRKTAHECHQLILKQGREFVVKNNVLMFYGGLCGKYALSAGALLQTLKTEGDVQIAYRVAYTICSKYDQPSLKAAKGYVGDRLKSEQTHPYVFYIKLSQSGAVIPERLAQLIRLHIELDIVSKRAQVPADIQRRVLRGEGVSFLTPSDRIPKTSQKKLRKATKVK
jgi:uncharacterized protein YwbE